MKFSSLVLTVALALSASPVLAEDFARGSWTKGDAHPESFNAKHGHVQWLKGEVAKWEKNAEKAERKADKKDDKKTPPVTVPVEDVSFPGDADDGTKSPAVADLAPTAPVPEPETYALMLAGLAAVGFIARRRNRKA